MNWTAITIDDLKAVAFGGIIDAAQAAAVGTHDPVAEAIADAVAAVRGAISTGNVLNADVTTVPGSLRSLTARTAAFALMDRVQMALSADQRTTRQADLARLQQIGAQKQRFEQADVPAGSGEMQPGPGLETIAPGNRGHSREELRGI